MLVFLDYSYLYVGGTQQLESCVICELNKRGMKAKVYCSRKSYLYKRLISLHADFIHIDSDVVPHHSFGKYLQSDDVVCVTEISRAILVFLNRKFISRLFFYSIHPDTFFKAESWVKKIPLYKIYIFDLLNLLFDKKALYFMDGPNVKGLERRGFVVDKNKIKYIPVPVMFETGIRRNNHSRNEVFRITYVGRGWEEWKIYPVIKLLEDINRIENKCSLTIITDTKEMFESMISEYLPDNNVKVCYAFGLNGQALEEYLLNNSDVHFSMGISALEGAKLGIPTILLDASHRKIPQNYKYHWLFEAKDYSLADFIDDNTSFSGMTINEIFHSISNDEYYNYYSEKCYNYVLQYHSQKAAVDKLLNAAESTQLSSNDFCRTMFMVRCLWLSAIVKLRFLFLMKIKKIV